MSQRMHAKCDTFFAEKNVPTMANFSCLSVIFFYFQNTSDSIADSKTKFLRKKSGIKKQNLRKC